MRLGTLVIGGLVCALLAPPASAACKWIDGADPAAPGDGGRGVSDWQVHYAAGTSTAAKVPGWIGSRFTTLKACLSQDDFARLYADVSVMIAHQGRKHAGWPDGGDAAVPGDGGRGISDWHAHQAWAMAPNAADVVHGLVEERLKALQPKLSKEVYGRLYADLSILIANYAR